MTPLWIIVPAYNEAAMISGLLGALADQTDPDFRLVVVDNGSTDDTVDVVRRFTLGPAARQGRLTAGSAPLTAPPFPVVVCHETRRGPGAAADTGFRYAITQGAVALARTDADCLPAADWVATAKAVLAAGAELACGRSVPRPDERPTWGERHLYPAAVRLAGLYGRFRTAHRRPEYRTPYVLCHGHNLVLTADLYLRCGGATPTPLEAGSEDVELLNRARRHSDRVVRAEHLVVYSSLRRLRAWGPRRTLLWHWDRRYRPAEVHIR